MKKLREILLDKKLYLFAIITICFFGEFTRLQYAPDTYTVFSGTTKAVVTQFLSCGRFVTAFAAGLCKGILNLSNDLIYILSYLFAIICTLISLYRLDKLISKEIKNNIVSIILSTLVIINIFSFELFIYIEKGVMMFSVLMCILALEQVHKLLANKSWKHMLISVIYMMIATCSYQGCVGVFVALSLIYIIKYSKTIKEFVYNNIKVASIYGIPAILNFLMVRVLGYNSRVDGKIILSESIQKVNEGTKNLLINTYGILPKYLFIGFIFAIVIFIIYKLIVSKEENATTKILKLSGAFYILAGTLFATIAPQILQNTDSIWFVARSSYPMASVIGILLIYVFLYLDVKNIEKNIIIIISVIFMCMTLYSFIDYAIDGYITDYEDKQETLKIIEQINKYEQETGYTINKIAFYNDKYVSYVHPEIRATGDINVRALCKDWSAIGIINLYSGRQLQAVEKEVEIEKIFKESDWVEYDEVQIIFKEDTMHFCIY